MTQAQGAQPANGFDAFPPPEMAERAIAIGVKKVNLPLGQMFLLAVLAGAFVALGAVFATVVTSGGSAVRGLDGTLVYTAGLPYGVAKLLAGMVFSLGLILVVVGGAELFTGNNLIIMAFLSGKVSLGRLLVNWLVVYLGNFVGSLATAILLFLSGQYSFGAGAVGANMLATAEAKTSLGFVQALTLAMMCNALVCLAVWLAYSARSTTDKIMAVLWPITAFVAAGFEHSVANMYFIPAAWLVKTFGSAAFFEAIHKSAADFPHITLMGMINNLIPVTLGNIIGGAVMVGAVYWVIYKNDRKI